MFKSYYDSPLGPITLLGDDQYLRGLWFNGQSYYSANYDLAHMPKKDTEPLVITQQWLDNYFGGRRPDPLQVPISPETTAFRTKVYDLLQQVPYGETTTYQELSIKLQQASGMHKNWSRAVGNAVAHNPILLIIPCHRVLGTDGSLTGYAGGLERKSKLLAFERSDADASN